MKMGLNYVFRKTLIVTSVTGLTKVSEQSSNFVLNSLSLPVVLMVGLGAAGTAIMGFYLFKLSKRVSFIEEQQNKDSGLLESTVKKSIVDFYNDHYNDGSIKSDLGLLKEKMNEFETKFQNEISIKLNFKNKLKHVSDLQGDLNRVDDKVKKLAIIKEILVRDQKMNAAAFKYLIENQGNANFKDFCVAKLAEHYSISGEHDFFD